MQNSITATLLSLTSVISPLIVLATSCYFVIKKASIEAILLLIGAGTGFILTLIYSVLMPYLMRNQHSAYPDITTIYTILGVVGFFSGLSFAMGFVILITNTVKRNQVVHNQFPPSND